MADRKVLVGDVDGLTGIIAHGAFNAGDKLRDPADNTILRPGPFFGDGALGDVTISTNTSITTPSMYNNLTIAAGVTVTVDAYFAVRGKLTLGDGAKIERNGESATSRLGATPGAVVYYGVGAPGGAGRLSTGTPGNGFSGNASTTAFGGSSGRGGNAGALTGGPGRSTTIPTALQGGRTALMNISRLMSGTVSSSRVTKFSGGAGGGGGAVGSATGEAGGGGAGGHVLVVFAHEIVVPVGTAFISANGGNGANGISGDAGGGGGGGGGCAIVVSSFEQPAGLTVQALGGTAGAGTGAGEAGINGATGVVRYYKFN